MATVSRFEDLEAWKLAKQLVNLIYDLLEKKFLGVILD